MKRKRGRPKIYESVEQMQIDIDAYFDDCESRQVPYTIAGLAHALGMDTDSLLNYEKKKGYEKFFGTVKEAKQLVDVRRLEGGLTGKYNPTLVIFLAKTVGGYQEPKADENKEITVRIIDETEGDSVSDDFYDDIDFDDD